MSTAIRLIKVNPAKEIDGAGNIITKTVLPPSQVVAPAYANPRFANPKFRWMPPLSYFCIKALVEFPEQVHQIGEGRLNIQPRKARGRKLLHSLFPLWETSHFTLLNVDPRIWAVAVQVYGDLPSKLRSYPATLSDPHLPLLNQIPSSPEFSLLTVLDLTASRQLTDSNIIALKTLHNLAALDVSETEITTHGLLLLSRTISYDSERRGPGLLRILKLRLTDVNDDINEILTKFPLLCAVDLRETQCSETHIRRPFCKSEDYKLFDAPLSDFIRALSLSYNEKDILTNKYPHILDVQEKSKRGLPFDSSRRVEAKMTATRSMHNSFVVFPKFQKNSKPGPLSFGNSDLIELRPEQDDTERRGPNESPRLPQTRVLVNEEGEDEHTWQDIGNTLNFLSDDGSDCSDGPEVNTKDQIDLSIRNTANREVSSSAFYKHRPDTHIPTVRKLGATRGLVIARTPPSIQELYTRRNSNSNSVKRKQGQEEIKIPNEGERRAFNERMMLFAKKRKVSCTELHSMNDSQVSSICVPGESEKNNEISRATRVHSHKPTAKTNHIALRKGRLKLEPSTSFSPSHATKPHSSSSEPVRFSNVALRQSDVNPKDGLKEQGRKIPRSNITGALARALGPKQSNSANSMPSKKTTSSKLEKLSNDNLPQRTKPKGFDWKSWEKR